MNEVHIRVNERGKHQPRIRSIWPCSSCGQPVAYHRGGTCRRCWLAHHAALTVDRFWAKVDASGDCWIWTGTTSGKGYGSTTVGGRHLYAHRLAYQWLVGPIPAGLFIDHRCRTLRCVNSAHLEVVTNSENVRRSPLGKGRTHHAFKLTHCHRGHALTGSNLVPRADGHRDCRECRHVRTRKVAA